MSAYLLVGLAMIGFVWMAWEVFHAPKGYQDKTGFHKGEGEDEE